MTSLTTKPELLAAVAADAADVGSVISGAATATAGPTTGVVAAAADEVSALTTRSFASYAQDFQALIGHAAAFTDKFAQSLAAAGSAFAAAEAHAASMLEAITAPVQAAQAPLTGGATPWPVSPQATGNADPPVTALLMMGGSRIRRVRRLPAVPDRCPRRCQRSCRRLLPARELSHAPGQPAFVGRYLVAVRSAVADHLLHDPHA